MRYYEHYKVHAYRINTFIIVLLLGTSTAGISGLFFWEKFSEVWAVIAAILQIVSTSTFLMPFSEQVWAIARLLPEFEVLINQVDHDWNCLDSKEHGEIIDLIYHYEQKGACFDINARKSNQFAAGNAGTDG